MGTLGTRAESEGQGRARRRKHVPLRTCVVCRCTQGKRELLRIVRTPEGTIELDPKGKRAGRGAYLCRKRECCEAALRQGVLGRALRAQITGEQMSELRAELERVLEQVPSAG